MTSTDDAAQTDLVRARALLAVAPLGIGELSLDGTLLWANQALADLFDEDDGDAAALMGRDGLGFLRPDDRPDLRNLPPEGRATLTCRAGRPGISGTIRVHLKTLWRTRPNTNAASAAPSAPTKHDTDISWTVSETSSPSSTRAAS
jgi:PAS domain-containing protein